MINTMLNTLLHIAQKDERVIIISIDDSEVFGKLKELGDRYICIGIQECNMLSVAGGIAQTGKKVFVIGGGTFLAYRGAEFIRNIICLNNRDVCVIGIGAGMAISVLGSTHHCTEDIGVLRSFIGLNIITPSNISEVEMAIRYSYANPNPVYLRLGRSVENKYADTEYDDSRIDKVKILKNGVGKIVFSYGSIIYDVMEAVTLLEEEGNSVAVAEVPMQIPLDEEIKSLSLEYENWLVVEEHNIYGGLGTILADYIAENNLNVKMSRMGLSNFSQGHGSYDDIKKHNGLGINKIYSFIKGDK